GGAAAGARGGRGAAAAQPDFAAFFGRGRGGPQLEWQPNIGGCESGFTIPDPTDPDIVYASCYGNKVTRWDAKIGTARSIEPWEISLDSAPNDVKYRCHWTAPMAIDPFDHTNVLYGCQEILRTTNGGQSWSQFSPDLSTKDPSRVVSNGGLVGDNLGQFDGEVVWDIEYSKIQRGLVWAGTNDGKFWYTKDDGAHWNDVTANFKDLAPWGTFSQIWPSTFDPGTVYVAVDFHLMNDYKPYIYKSTDFGATWTKINGNIPTGNPLDYLLSLSGNPNRKGMLFAGSAHAFYYTMDDGATWTKFNEGLPPAPVSWIAVEPRFHDVAISTYGRGLYVLPDITLLEQTGKTTPPTATSNVLYDPAPIIREARSVFQQGAVRPQFELQLASAPSAQIKMEILDSAGKMMRTEEVTAHEGLNGFDWDLHLDGPTLVALRTTPPENPDIWSEPRFQNTDVRRITHWGITPQTGIPMAAPGKYQVRFTVNGQQLTKPFEVIKDPKVEASDADLQLSTATQIQIRDDITNTSKMVNRMEVWRKQVQDQIKANQGKPEVVKQLQAMNKQILDVELQLVSRSEMLSDDKYFPEAYKVYMNLIWLSGGVGQGASDEAGSIDNKPTDTQLQVLKVIEGNLEKAQGGFSQLVTSEIPAFNKTMAGKVPPITDTVPGGETGIIGDLANW
ncbi:MAG: WD40/YVTN/BNR-like repeat-containing protein, partial [Vicinamibacterales bacterium]